jgi:hypothetical protein
MSRRKLLNWSQPLPATIAVESRKLATLRDLAELVADLPKARRDRYCWIIVANALMAAAKGGDVFAATELFRFARMLDRAPL